MSGLLQNPYKLNMMLQGLGLLTSKYEDQAERYQGNITGLLSNKTARDARVAETQKQRDYNDPYRQAQIDHMKAQTANLGGGASPKVQKLADGRAYWVAPGVEPTLVNPNIEKPENKMQSFDGESKLRKEYNDNSGEYMKQTHAYKRVVSSAQDPSAAGDLALIFNYMKVLDPGSTVREGEFATAQNSGGIDSKVRSMYNSIINGKRLDHKQRADFVDRAGRLYHGAQELQGGVDNRYKSLAEAYGVTADNILYNPGLSIYEYPEGLESSTETRVIDNVTYTKRGDDWYAE